MADDESTSFDSIAHLYDQSSAPMYAESIVGPTVDLLAELAGSGRALELGIGTGRIALPLAARGVPVVGIDASPAMVQVMRGKTGGDADAIPVAIGDFATTAVEGKFSLAYAVFNALWNLRTQEKQVACFQNVARHLEAGGCFLIELFVPDLQQISPGNNIKAIRADSSGMSFDVYDVVSQRLISNHFWINDGKINTRSSKGRYAWPAEIDLMGRLAGMRLQDRWGGWKKEPFTESSRSHVSVYEKP